MIDIEKLKPIIEPLLTDDNSASIIEKIQAIDEQSYSQTDLDNLNRDWSDRFKKAFFNGSVEETIETEDEPEETEEPQKFDELFTEEKEDEDNA